MQGRHAMQHFIAGRHGSYATQFARPPAKTYPTRAAMRAAVSRKHLERRLVIPLDCMNWMRALEVLHAGYARLSRTPEHFQRVIRVMVSAAGSSPTGRASIAERLHLLRDQAYGGDIPSNSSLFLTFIWAYATLQDAEAAAESFFQCCRRGGLSKPSCDHAVEMLMPLLCRCGHRELAEEVLRAAGRVDGEPYSPLLAEAAGLRGNWEDALQLAGTAGMKDRRISSSLFAPSDCSGSKGLPDKAVNECRLATQRYTSRDEGAPVPLVQGSSGAKETGLRLLSAAALRQMLYQALRDGECSTASRLFDELFTSREERLTEEDFYVLINGLGSLHKWEEVVRLFTLFFLPQFPPEKYLPPAPLNGDGVAGAPETRGDAKQPEPLCFLPSPSQVPVLALTPVALNAVFSCYPERVPAGDEDDAVWSRLLHAAQHPHLMRALLDDLLQTRDDIVITNYMLARLAPALVQLGDAPRALQLLTQASLLRPPSPSLTHPLTKTLVQIIFFIHFYLSDPGSSRKRTQMGEQGAPELVVTYFSFLFPPSLRGRTSVKGEGDAVTSEEVERRWNASHQGDTTTSALTEKQDRAMKENFLSLRARGGNNFHGDPERDPRPAPRGLHDTASGWNFVGRGGEMVFSNSRRVPHLLSAHPKVMRSKLAPYRGWSVKQNSSLAHLENVKKWNGKSSV